MILTIKYIVFMHNTIFAQYLLASSVFIFMQNLISIARDRSKKVSNLYCDAIVLHAMTWLFG